jgi:hypothetical protein
MKLVVFALLAAIIISLGSGLFYLSRDDSDSGKVLKALKIRVALSAALILFLVASYYMGYIQYTKTYRPTQTTSTKCQYHATASKAK